MNILFITNGYPSAKTPFKTIFLQRLIHELADQGHECTVIRPVAFPQEKSFPSETEEHKTVRGNIVKVFHPRYLRFWFGARWKHDFFKKISECCYSCAAIRTIRKQRLKFDAVYAHFLSTPARCALKIGEKFHVPVFAAAGESEFKMFEEPDRERTKACLNRLTGIISVSSENKRQLLKHGILDDERIYVYPNGIDDSVFYKRDKQLARKTFGFDEKDFLVAFTGYFIDRKGPLRVEKATKALDVKVAYAGKGEQTPTAENTVWAKPVAPEQMPLFLSAADVFVLPTLNEGCCNAIIEAMACGLPVISSDCAFNDDILNEACSIRTDPTDCESIRDAILLIKEDPQRRESMSNAALDKAKHLRISQRASSIALWMQEKMESL